MNATETIRGFDDKQKRAAAMCFLLLCGTRKAATDLIDNVHEFDEETGDIGSLFWELVVKMDEVNNIDPDKPRNAVRGDGPCLTS